MRGYGGAIFVLAPYVVWMTCYSYYPGILHFFTVHMSAMVHDS